MQSSANLDLGDEAWSSTCAVCRTSSKIAGPRVRFGGRTDHERINSTSAIHHHQSFVDTYCRNCDCEQSPILTRLLTNARPIGTMLAKV